MTIIITFREQNIYKKKVIWFLLPNSPQDKINEAKHQGDMDLTTP